MGANNDLQETLGNESMSRIETLARVDERTKAMQADLAQFRQDVNKSLNDIGNTIKDTETRNKENFNRLEDNLNSFKEESNNKFVRKEEFDPVRKVVYSILYITGAVVLAGLLGLIIHSNLSLAIK